MKSHPNDHWVFFYISSFQVICTLQNEVMNSTFCIEDKDSSSNITPTSTANLVSNNSRTRKVLKMIEKNCPSSEEFEKPKSRLGIPDSSNSMLAGGVKRKRKLLKSGSFFEPL